MGLFSGFSSSKTSSPAGNIGSSHQGDGKVDRVDFKNLHRDIRNHFGERGEALSEILLANMDTDSSSKGLHAMSEREFNDTLHQLRNNHSDHFTSKDVDTLEGLVRQRL